MKHFYHKNVLSNMLLPLSWVYYVLYKLRCMVLTPYRASVPVICIGNITVGGTGKTPTCRSVLGAISPMYKNPIIVSRGHGGKLSSAQRVDVNIHTAHEVGDEPLMLAKSATVVVSKNKKQGVIYAESLGADIILLDDGLQNPTVHKDIHIVVVDGYRGFGNGRMLPAGPLREMPKRPLENADIILITGIKDMVYKYLSDTYTDKIIFAKYVPTHPPFDDRQSVVPFAGLGNPDKFFETVRQCGYPIRAKLSYPDHHMYTDGDIADLHSVANTALAKLITTEKDFVRLSASQQKEITPLCVVLEMEQKNWASYIIDKLPPKG